MNIKDQCHSLTLVQGYSDSTFSSLFSVETARPIEVKFQVAPPWDGKMKVYPNGWMDELGFYVPSTVFQSFRDDGRVNMKGSVQ